MALTELMLWSLSSRTWQTSVSVGRQCRLSQSFRRLLRFTGQSSVHAYRRLYFIIIIKEKINVAFSPKTARTRNTHKVGRQRKKQEGQQRHQYEGANKYVFKKFKCRLKVDSDDDDVTNDGKLFHAWAAATGKARSPIVQRRVTGTTTAVDELERRLRLVPTSAARLMQSDCPPGHTDFYGHHTL